MAITKRKLRALKELLGKLDTALKKDHVGHVPAGVRRRWEQRRSEVTAQIRSVQVSVWARWGWLCCRTPPGGR